jgi:hypothetical protein
VYLREVLEGELNLSSISWLFYNSSDIVGSLSLTGFLLYSLVIGLSFPVGLLFPSLLWDFQTCPLAVLLLGTRLAGCGF